jgi:hypothetical protein
MRLVDRLADPQTLERAVRRTGNWLNFRGRHELVDRRRGADRLVMVLAGHKPALWDVTLSRLARHVPADADVCLVMPAVRPPKLLERARAHGWSVLMTAANHVSLAQNLALRAHPDAHWIFKLDEDVVVGEDFFDRLQGGYERVAAEGRFRPGICAPVLNVNGFSYVRFLQTLDLEEAYLERFGELRQAASDLRITEDGEAAVWVWEHSVPFDEIAARFAAEPFGYDAVPHRFSIGAILYERDLWERMGGIRVRPPTGWLGMDEKYLCRKCHDFSRPVLVLHDILAGHISYARQEPAMLAALDRLRPGLLPAGRATEALR